MNTPRTQMDDVITLESDDEESGGRQEASTSLRNGSSSSFTNQTAPIRGLSGGASATAAIVMEKPLDLESLFNMATEASSFNSLVAGASTFSHSIGGTHSAVNHSGGSSYNNNGNGAAVNGVSHVVYPRSVQHLPQKRPAVPATLPLLSASQPTTAKRMRVDAQGSNNLTSTVAKAVSATSSSLNHCSSIIRPTSVQQLQRAGILPRMGPGGAMNNVHNRTHNLFADANSPAAVHAKMAQFANTYLECTDPKQNVVEDEFAGQFKCTYNSCNKRLRNNITFMYHIWAHTNRFRSTVVEEDVTNLQLAAGSTGRHESGAYEVKDDVARLRTCPECLITQPSPNRMHLHYHRVHKRSPYLVSGDLTVCAICESVLRSSSETVTTHFQRHGQYDLPYICKRCKYRSSSREALLRHFAEHHSGSSMVLCPFCLTSFTVPYNDRQRSTVVMKAYVQHIWDHETYHQHACQQCASRVVRSDPVSTQQKMMVHSKVHAKNDPKWRYERKRLTSIHKSQSKMICWSTELPQVCVECRYVVDGGARMKSQQERHFKELKKCSLPKCTYESACATALEMHEVLALCQGWLRSRWPFGRPKTSHYLPSIMEHGMSALSYQCSSCSFTTPSADAMSTHLGSKDKCMGATARLINGPVGDLLAAANSSKPHSPTADYDESLEAFGLLRLADNEVMENGEGAPEPPSPKKRKPIDEALSTLLPLAKVNHVRDNRKLVKFLTCDLLPSTDADDEDPEFLKLMASFKCLTDTVDVKNLCKCLHDLTSNEGEEEEGDD